MYLLLALALALTPLARTPNQTHSTATNVGLTQEQVENAIDATGRTHVFEGRGFYARAYTPRKFQKWWVLTVRYVPDRHGILRAVSWWKRMRSADDRFERLPLRIEPIEKVTRVGDRWDEAVFRLDLWGARSEGFGPGRTYWRYLSAKYPGQVIELYDGEEGSDPTYVRRIRQLKIYPYDPSVRMGTFAPVQSYPERGRSGFGSDTQATGPFWSPQKVINWYADRDPTDAEVMEALMQEIGKAGLQ